MAWRQRSKSSRTSTKGTSSTEPDGANSANFPFSVRTGEWVGDCFLYTSSTNRLNYLVGDQTYTVSHFDQPMYILGYIQRDSRMYLADKDVNVTSFALSLPVFEYQTLVLRGDMDTAAELLSNIPDDQMNKIARFLEGQGHKELALEVATDPEHKFELALGLSQLDIALELAKVADVEHKWKTVGDAALTGWDVSLATECFTHAKDLGSLLLIYSSTADRTGLANLAEQATAAGLHNIAFNCHWLLGDVAACIDILKTTNRLAEAVLFSQTYKPSLTPDLVQEWKVSLEKGKKARVARILAAPREDDELFPEWEEWLRLENEGGTVGDSGVAEVDDAEENGEAEDE
jgi:coatomer subunit beta'